MTMLITVLMVVVVPLTGLAAVLITLERRERARAERILRQVRVTDAIHRELGAVAAPLVSRRPGGGWRVAMAVPFEAPVMVGRIGVIAREAMLRGGAGEPVEVVLTAAREVGVLRRAPVNPREVTTWTGSTMSRAS